MRKARSSGTVCVAGMLVCAGSAFGQIRLWEHHYDGPGGWPDWARAIAVDASGNVCVTGPSNGGYGGSDYATVKYLLRMATSGLGSGLMLGGRLPLQRRAGRRGGSPLDDTGLLRALDEFKHAHLLQYPSFGGFEMGHLGQPFGVVQLRQAGEASLARSPLAKGTPSAPAFAWNHPNQREKVQSVE